MAFIVDKLLEYVVDKPLGAVGKLGLKGATKIGQAALRGIEKAGKATLNKRHVFANIVKREGEYLAGLGEDIGEILAHNPFVRTQKVSSEKLLREQLTKKGLAEEEIEKRIEKLREGFEVTKQKINEKYDNLIESVKSNKHIPEDRKAELIQRYEAQRQKELANVGYTRIIELDKKGMQEIGAFNYLFLGGLVAGGIGGLVVGTQKTDFHNIVPTTQLYGSLSSYEIPENIIVPQQVEDAMESYSRELATGELVLALHQIARGGGR